MDKSDMDHRAIIGSLSPTDRAELTRRLDTPGLIRFTVHFGAILVLGAFILRGIPFWPALLVPQGILIIFLFTALHEAIHGTAFRSGRLNQAVAGLSGLLVFIPPTWFRYFHFAHHRHTHDPENDPELMSPKPETVAQYALYLSGFPLWASMARTIVANAIRGTSESFVPAKGRLKVTREARLFLALYVCIGLGSIAAGSAALVWMWAIPALLGQPFLRAYLLAEHARCPHVANMLENTRTTFTTSLVRLVTWNMSYHAEHHVYPAVPFHKLPLFHTIVRKHLKTTERGYARFNRNYWADLR